MNTEPSDLSELARELTFHRLTPAQQRLWKQHMRRMPQWFVVRKSLWKTDRWRAVAGPTRSQYRAQRLARQLSLERVGGVSQRMYRTQVKSLSEIMHLYNNDVIRLVDDLSDAERFAPGSAAH